MIQIIEKELVLLKLIADKYNTQEVCEKAVKMKDWKLCFVPNHLKTQEMYKKAIQEDPWSPDYLKTPQKCKRVAQEDSYTLKFVLYQYKTPEIQRYVK